MLIAGMETAPYDNVEFGSGIQNIPYENATGSFQVFTHSYPDNNATILASGRTNSTMVLEPTCAPSQQLITYDKNYTENNDACKIRQQENLIPPYLLSSSLSSNIKTQSEPETTLHNITSKGLSNCGPASNSTITKSACVPAAKCNYTTAVRLHKTRNT